MARLGLLDRWKQALNRAKGDAQRFVQAHVELARIEASETGRTLAAHLVGVVVAGAVMLIGLALLAVGVSLLLDGVWGVSTGGWLTIFAAGFLLAGGVTLAVILRRLRGQPRGFEQTAEVLREDAAWLADALARRSEPDEDAEHEGAYEPEAGR